MDIKDFKVGQNAFVRLTGNASRGKKSDELIEEWEVISVGKKLIKAKRKCWSDVYAVTFEKREYGYNGKFVEKTNTCVDYILHVSREEIEDELEREKLLDYVSNYFRDFGEKRVSLENLRKIVELIKETE